MQKKDMNLEQPYKCPAGEEGFWHILMSPKSKYNPETGEEVAKTNLHKVKDKTFRKCQQIWILQGYDITVLHNPEEYLRKQAEKKR